MALFNIDDFSEMVFHDIFSCGEVTIFCFFNDYYPNKVILDVYTYQGDLSIKPRETSISYINAEIRDNHVYIIDCRSKIENNGNGKKMFYNFMKYIKSINEVYPLSRISGFLSPKDSDDWKKLFYFYSTLGEYIKISTDLSIKLNFQLRDYSTSEFTANIEENQNNYIYFDFYLNYQ